MFHLRQLLALSIFGLYSAVSGITLSEATKGQPKDIQTFLERSAACQHFGGEEGYDAERRAFLNKQWKKYKCERIDRDLLRLKKKYAKQRNHLKILEKYEDIEPD